MIRHKYTNEFTRVNDKVPVPLPCAPAIDTTLGTATPTARNPFWIRTRQDQNHKVTVIPKRRAVGRCTVQESRSLPWVSLSSTTAGLQEKDLGLTCPSLNSRDTPPYAHKPPPSPSHGSLSPVGKRRMGMMGTECSREQVLMETASSQA
jgi:hypothetical protein